MTKIKCFYDFYLQKNRDRDIINQKVLLDNARIIKLASQSISSPPKFKINITKSDIKDATKLFLKSNSRKGQEKNLIKSSQNLYDKIVKQLDHRGCIAKRTTISICDEILDPLNSSSKLHYAISPRKQGVEDLQKEYLFEYFGVKLTPLPKSGKNCYRFNKLTGELELGKPNRSKQYSKSMDGKFKDNIFTFQKVTTDDGGSTNSVEDEVSDTVNLAVLHHSKFPKSEYIFIFLLDGPYWNRKSSENKSKTRLDELIDQIPHILDKKIIICSSDTLSLR